MMRFQQPYHHLRPNVQQRCLLRALQRHSFSSSLKLKLTRLNGFFISFAGDIITTPEY